MDGIEKFDLLACRFLKAHPSIITTAWFWRGVDVERFNFITFFGLPR